MSTLPRAAVTCSIRFLDPRVTNLDAFLRLWLSLSSDPISMIVVVFNPEMIRSWTAMLTGVSMRIQVFSMLDSRLAWLPAAAAAAQTAGWLLCRVAPTDSDRASCYLTATATVLFSEKRKY